MRYYVNIKLLLILSVILSTAGMTSPASADPVATQKLFYTTFQGGQNVWSVDFSYDGAATVILGVSQNLCSTAGADGIAGNPQNPDLLLVGGQNSGVINTCSISTGTATAFPSLTNVFHLEVPDSTTVFGNGIPGSLVKHTINPDGSLTVGTAIAITAGPDAVFTQIIDTPGPNGIDGDGDDITFYSNNGIYGIITFTGAATATTARLHGAGGAVSGVPLAGAHGGVYDPFTQNVITFGGDNIVQLDLVGNIVGFRLGTPGSNFDQGTVDGNGHLFIAKNPDLYFLDYSATGNVGAGGFFQDLSFLKTALDDIAPLVGSGATNGMGPTVGGEYFTLDTTALLVAGLQTPMAWMMYAFSAIGIGAFLFTRNTNNIRNVKVILQDYLDRFG